jgi:hypothetical protein
MIFWRITSRTSALPLNFWAKPICRASSSNRALGGRDPAMPARCPRSAPL